MRTVGVSGVIRNPAGQLLLVRTDKAGWELPGGRVESAEDLFDALRRECLEEAGCVVEPGQILGVYAHTSQDLLILVVSGASTTEQPAPSRSEEKVLEAAWFAPERALELVTHGREREALANGLAFTGTVTYGVYR